MLDRVNPIDPTVELVNGPGTYETTGVTLGNHMVAGIRCWRVVIQNYNPVVLKVETEAYEQTAGTSWGQYELNSFGRDPLFGQNAQYTIWDTYLNNIASYWSSQAGATSSGAVHIQSTDTGSTANP